MADKEFCIDLVVFLIEDDVILGMDSLSSYRVIPDCFDRKLTFNDLVGYAFYILWGQEEMLTHSLNLY